MRVNPYVLLVILQSMIVLILLLGFAAYRLRRSSLGAAGPAPAMDPGTEPPTDREETGPGEQAALPLEPDDPTRFDDPADQAAPPEARTTDEGRPPGEEDDPARVEPPAGDSDGAASEAEAEPNTTGADAEQDPYDIQEIVKGLEDIMRAGRNQKETIRTQLNELGTMHAGVKEYEGLIQACLESFDKMVRDIKSAKRDIFLCYETQRVCTQDQEQKYTKLQDAVESLTREKERLLEERTRLKESAPPPADTGTGDPGSRSAGEPTVQALREEMERTENEYMTLYSEYGSIQESSRASGQPEMDPETSQKVQDMEAELARKTARMEEIDRQLQSLAPPAAS